MKRTLAALLLSLAFPLGAQSLSTGFEPPEFVLGDVDGQNGWGHVSNSPTGGTIEPVPAGSPAMFGTQSLAIRTRNVLFYPVANHLHSPAIDPPAGETGSTAGGVPATNPQSHFAATLWFHTPATPLISTRSDGRFAELNPSSKGANATDPANRYAQVRLFNTTNDATGRVRVEIGWYSDIDTFTVATVALLDWGQWYRFEYLIELVDGVNGPAPNDRFTLTVFDLAGTQLGTACGSTWEIPYKSGGFGGGTTPRAIDSFDLWSTSGPDGNLAGHLDNFSMNAFTPATALGVTISGSATACFGGTTLLTANATEGGAPITGYVWRDALSNVVGTSSTFGAGAGTYTVTVTDALCGSVTSTPFAVTQAAALAVTITGASSVPPGQTTTLTANVTGGSGSITGYVWRDALSNVVGSGPTLDAGPGTYTVMVTDASCGNATSPPFTVALTVIPVVPTLGEMSLVAMLLALAGIAVLRVR
jgi:hypothetical protein